MHDEAAPPGSTWLRRGQRAGEGLPRAAAVLALLLGAAALLAAPLAAHAQQGRTETDLGRLYQRARSEALLQHQMQQEVRAAPPAPLRTARLDSLRAQLDPAAAASQGLAALPLPSIRARRVVSPSGRAVFEERFGEVDWSYLGANSRALLDTMQTRRLRARLQALYGDPTLTVVDIGALDGRPAADYIQFAYWMVINDGFEEPFPVKVVDTGGPFDRGLVFAAPARFRTRLRALREAVLAPLRDTRLRARYVDYYYDASDRVWYRTGFDGRRFFARPVRRSEVEAGQRPRQP